MSQLAAAVLPCPLVPCGPKAQRDGSGKGSPSAAAHGGLPWLPRFPTGRRKDVKTFVSSFQPSACPRAAFPGSPRPRGPPRPREPRRTPQRRPAGRPTSSRPSLELGGAAARLPSPLRSLPFEFPRRLQGGGRVSLCEGRGRREEGSGAPPGLCGAGRRCSRALAASEAIGSAQSPHAGLQRRPPRIGARAGVHRSARERVRAARAALKPTYSSLGSPCP